MLSKEIIIALARRYQISEFPNIVREYFQHLFLFHLYKIEGAEHILFKGGTALRFIYNSPRFSEDLDFSIFGVESHRQKDFIENIFIKVLAEIANIGIKVEIGPKPGPTKGGYYGDATFGIYDYPPATVSINISARNEKEIKSEPDSIVNDFVPAYTVLHLPQEELVEEKIFNALLERKKPRDFYDLYFIMRKNMLTSDQKKRLSAKKEYIIAEAKKINFQIELGTLLPADQHNVIKDFPAVLERELNRQLSGL